MFAHNRFGAFSFHDGDHLRWGAGSARERVTRYLQDQGVSVPLGRIRLLTHLRVFGYVFNPVSFYFCDDLEGEPVAVIAEVHNTYREQKPYLLVKPDAEGRFLSTYPKTFYISPFSPLDPSLTLRIAQPDTQLNITVSSKRAGEDQPFFVATLQGRRQRLSARRLAYYALRFPCISMQVMAKIHWHALRLYLRGNPVYAKSDHPELQQDVLTASRSR